jgi:3-oxoacyl-[acyl-carrier protein] reductase
LELFVKAHLTHRALILRQAARNFLNRGQGRALLVSTTAAGRPKPGQGFYAAVKRGAEALYRNLGVELGSRGITAVTLRPGYVDAGRGRVYLSAVPDALAGVPTGRALTPGEVADALVFLLSDNARSFNATELTMDGGLTATK